MSRILVIGESVLDEVQAADGTVTAHPGGSPANVAVGLARLRQRATLVSQVGDDDPGIAIRTHLEESGVELVECEKSVRTPVARAVVGDGGAATYQFDIAWTLTDRVQDEADFGHVHTGSIAAHVDPGAATVEAIIRRARTHATVSYDPNVRETLVGERADVVVRTERFVGLADVVKASDEDLAWLYPGTDAAEVIHAWTTMGPSIVVATLGAEGSLVCVRGTTLRVEPIKVTVAATVGAGDSYMAALIDGLAREGWTGRAARARLEEVSADDVARVVGRSARAAAITVSRAGANPPTLEELDGTA